MLSLHSFPSILFLALKQQNHPEKCKKFFTSSQPLITNLFIFTIYIVKINKSVIRGWLEVKDVSHIYKTKKL